MVHFLYFHSFYYGFIFKEILKSFAHYVFSSFCFHVLYDTQTNMLLLIFHLHKCALKFLFVLFCFSFVLNDKEIPLINPHFPFELKARNYTQLLLEMNLRQINTEQSCLFPQVHSTRDHVLLLELYFKPKKVPYEEAIILLLN